MIVESHEVVTPHEANGIPVENPQDSEALESEFNRLAAEWKEQGKYLSSPTAIADLPAYQKIIEMGAAALPLILKDLSREPHHWFVALGRITGESPIPRDAYGYMERMAQAWLKWGREHGIVA